MSMFSIGLSGLNTAQSALNTTSNNISNVYTPGYNREIAQLGEGPAGSKGVQINDIERQFNRFVADQLNDAKTQSSALQAYEGQINQIDNLLADRDAGLAPLMQNFFSSLEDLSSAPSDPAARQGVIGAAQTMTAQFRSFDGYLQDMQGNVNSEIKDEIIQINNKTEQIAGLNREIALARAQNGEAPNGMLNQRDHLISELNESMDIRLNIQDGKSYNVSLPNGQPLVTGTNALKLEAVASELDPQRTVVGYRDANGKVAELDENLIQGGQLGGLMGFRQESLDRTQNQIGQLAASLAGEFNAQHQEGFDLNGDRGGDFFSLGSPQFYGAEGNSNQNLLESVEFQPIETQGTEAVSRFSELRASDYTLSFDADSEPLVTRNDTGEAVALNDNIDNGKRLISFDGVTAVFDANANIQEGDSFEIQPVRRAAADMSVAITDLDKIAAGQGIDTEVDLDNQVAAGIGDNRNVLALQDLQSKPIVGGNASVSSAYGGIVSDVGNRTNITQVNLDARQGLTDQLRAVQQSESGVNLDEEAANLIRYQQYYQANAQVIDSATTIMDTILGLRS